MSDAMKRYELIKYKYGRKDGRSNNAYTAFCLTPASKPHEEQLPSGSKVLVTNLGRSSDQAHYFQSSENARHWMRGKDIQLVNPDWTPLEGTTVWPPVRQAIANDQRLAAG
jgi:hypothetical protein